VLLARILGAGEIAKFGQKVDEMSAFKSRLRLPEFVGGILAQLDE
jgi:hypothetical protein